MMSSCGTCPLTLAPALVKAVHESDREQPVVDLLPMEAVVAQSTTDQRFTMWLLAAFAVSGCVPSSLLP